MDPGNPSEDNRADMNVNQIFESIFEESVQVFREALKFLKDNQFGFVWRDKNELHQKTMKSARKFVLEITETFRSKHAIVFQNVEGSACEMFKKYFTDKMSDFAKDNIHKSDECSLQETMMYFLRRMSTLKESLEKEKGEAPKTVSDGIDEMISSTDLLNPIHIHHALLCCRVAYECKDPEYPDKWLKDSEEKHLLGKLVVSYSNSKVPSYVMARCGDVLYVTFRGLHPAKILGPPQRDWRGKISSRHSSGGTIASLVVIFLLEKFKYVPKDYLNSNLKCITFGITPVGNISLKKYVESIPGAENCFWHIVNKDDIIPKLFGNLNNTEVKGVLLKFVDDLVQLPLDAMCLLQPLSPTWDSMSLLWGKMITLAQSSDVMEHVLPTFDIFGMYYILDSSVKHDNPKCTIVPATKASTLLHLEQRDLVEIHDAHLENHRVERYQHEIRVCLMGELPELLMYQANSTEKPSDISPEISEVQFENIGKQVVAKIAGSNMWFVYEVSIDDNHGLDVDHMPTAESEVQTRIPQVTLVHSEEVTVRVKTHFENSKYMKTKKVAATTTTYEVSRRQEQLAKHSPCQVIELAYLSALLEHRDEDIISPRYHAIQAFFEDAVSVVPIESLFHAMATCDPYIVAQCCQVYLSGKKLPSPSDPSKLLLSGMERAISHIADCIDYCNMQDDEYRRFACLARSRKENIFDLFLANKGIIIYPQRQYCDANPPDEFRRANPPDESSCANSPDESSCANPPDEFRRANSPDEFRRANSPDEFRRANSPDESCRANPPDESCRAFLQHEFRRANLPHPNSEEWGDVVCSSVFYDAFMQATKRMRTFLKEASKTSIHAKSLCDVNLKAIYPSFTIDVEDSGNAKSSGCCKAPMTLLTDGRDELNRFSEEMNAKLGKDEECASSSCNSEMLKVLNGLRKNFKTCSTLLGAFMEAQVQVPLEREGKRYWSQLVEHENVFGLDIWGLLILPFREVNRLLASLPGHFRKLVVNLASPMAYIHDLLTQKNHTVTSYDTKMEFLVTSMKKSYTANREFVSYSLERQLVKQCGKRNIDDKTPLNEILQQWQANFKDEILTLVPDRYRPLVARWIKWSLMINHLRESIAEQTAVGVIGLVNSGKSKLVQSLFGIKTITGTTAQRRTTLPFIYNLEPEIKGMDVIDFPGVDDKDETIPELAKLLLSLTRIVVFVVEYKRAHTQATKDWLDYLEKENVPVLICLSFADKLYAELMGEDGNRRANEIKYQIDMQLKELTDKIGKPEIGVRDFKFTVFSFDNDSKLNSPEGQKKLRQAGLSDELDVGRWIAHKLEHTQSELSQSVFNFVQGKTNSTLNSIKSIRRKRAQKTKQVADHGSTPKRRSVEKPDEDKPSCSKDY